MSPSRLLILMLSVVFVLGMVSPSPAAGGHKIGQKMAGTYLWTEDGSSQRVVTITRGGEFSSVSEVASEYGFTDGLGSARRTGKNEVTATQVDFNYDKVDGTPTGVTRVIFSMVFADKEQGQFQTVSGSLMGVSYEVGENPLNPSTKPTGTFTYTFSGQRVRPN